MDERMNQEYLSAAQTHEKKSNSISTKLRG